MPFFFVTTNTVCCILPDTWYEVLRTSYTWYMIDTNVPGTCYVPKLPRCSGVAQLKELALC